ncbi:CLUMA_CG021279, isoform A [Clunio marinus]|uniref:CLUMA_CG021279, isoform A n=1 Tax=Clunio marinus TaxID=568069 RepID=A0A1J1J9J5_9DIPT|nr:CLUMA_CG021279, isoform A [Clunio marinus]
MNVLMPLRCLNHSGKFFRSSFRYSRNIFPKQLAVTPFNNQLIEHHRKEAFSSTAIIENDSRGIFQKILGRFENSKTKLRVSGTLLYENVANTIDYKKFLEEYGLSDTFYGWFLITELHCWLLLTRVMQEGSESGQDGRFLRNCLVEAMWADVQTRAKKLSVDNPSANRRQISELAEQFQAALIIYDEGLMSNDIILANALWRRFFNLKCDDYTKLEKLVMYCQNILKMLPLKSILLDSSAFLLRGSVLVAFLMLFIQLASTNKFGSVHKTKEAQETKAELFCFSCDMMTDSENCVNINKTRQLNLTKKCENDQNFCVVKRFSYTMSDKNSTSQKKLWSLQRHCTDTCENGCIVIGERVKLYACSSCCSNNLCNISSKGRNIRKNKFLIMFILVLPSISFLS